jgi:hypothetical protein
MMPRELPFCNEREWGAFGVVLHSVHSTLAIVRAALLATE